MASVQLVYRVGAVAPCSDRDEKIRRLDRVPMDVCGRRCFANMAQAKGHEISRENVGVPALWRHQVTGLARENFHQDIQLLCQIS